MGKISNTSQELFDKGIIVGQFRLRYDAATQNPLSDEENYLLKISETCKNVSGRTLRKVPFLAHMKHLKARSCILLEA